MSLSSWKTLDLRDRFILLVLLVFLVFSGVIGWDFVIDRDQEINAAKKELLSEVKVLAARQQSLVAQADAIMSGLTLNPELQPGEATGPCMQAFLARLKQHEEFIQAGLVLPNGELACAAAPPTATSTLPTGAGSRLPLRHARWSSARWLLGESWASQLWSSPRRCATRPTA